MRRPDALRTYARVGDVSTPVERDLLLKDFDHFAESFWRNEALGETRFPFPGEGVSWGS